MLKRSVPMIPAHVEVVKNIRTVMGEPVALQSDKAKNSGTVSDYDWLKMATLE